MEAKDSKVSIYIAILVAVILIVAGSYFVLGEPSKISNGTPSLTPEKAPSTIVKENTTTTNPPPAVTTSVATASVEATTKCEVCHKDTQNLPQHIDGGKLCVNCHGSQMHNIHIGPGTVGLQCDACHGFPPTIPTVANGTGPGHYVVCENCHAPPPDSLKPSYGNLIVVHLSRGKYCTNCHGSDIVAIHAAALANLTKK